MKKAILNPITLVLALGFFFVCGIVWGRHSTKTVIKLSINEVTGRPIAHESEETAPEDYVVGDKIDINTASVEIFLMFPGFGEVLAQRIVDYRTEHGPFKSVDDLLNVEGIGQSKLDSIRNYLTVVKDS